MRRAICIIMVLLFLATIITGILEPHLHPGDAGHHIVIAILFIVAVLTHVVVNRKPFARHFLGPGKKAE